jgi:hypothetical protein
MLRASLHCLPMNEICILIISEHYNRHVTDCQMLVSLHAIIATVTHTRALVSLRPVPRFRIPRLVWWYTMCDAQRLRDILFCVAQLQSSRWGDNRSWELTLHDRLISIFCACSFFPHNPSTSLLRYDRRFLLHTPRCIVDRRHPPAL